MTRVASPRCLSALVRCKEGRREHDRHEGVKYRFAVSQTAVTLAFRWTRCIFIYISLQSNELPETGSLQVSFRRTCRMFFFFWGGRRGETERPKDRQTNRNGSKTHKRLKERFLIGRNRTKIKFVQLQSVLLISCVSWIFLQNAGSQLCFRFFLTETKTEKREYISISHTKERIM